MKAAWDLIRLDQTSTVERPQAAQPTDIRSAGGHRRAISGRLAPWPTAAALLSWAMSLSRTPKAVIFDMDGLLFDTEALYNQALSNAAEQLGHLLTTELMLSMIGLPWAAVETHLRPHFGDSFDVERFLQITQDEFHAREAAELCMKQGVVEILDALDAMGMPRAIATSSARQTVDRHLDQFGLVGRFHTVVASGDYARGKPAPDPYLTAATRLSVDPLDCLALEDSYTGVRAAAAAGMMTIMVPDILGPTDEMRSLCIRIADDLHEVRALLAARPQDPADGSKSLRPIP
jgi:HAD superfamily hydrolase (TIGR01509 family)